MNKIKTLAAALAVIAALPLPVLADEAHQRVYCKRALRQALRDPDSLKIPWGGITVFKNGFVRIEYRAKNGFGGMTPGNFYCKFNGRKLINVSNG